MTGADIIDQEADDKGQMELDELMDCYGTSLLRLCYMYLKDYSLAEDAVQDTFVSVYKNMGNFRNECSEKTWITKIAVNVCKSYMRRAWSKRIFPSDTMPDSPYHDNFNKNIEHEGILGEVMKLQPRYREVILLYYYSELKIPEISKVLGIPEGTVSVRLKRGRDKLKNALEDWYYE